MLNTTQIDTIRHVDKQAVPRRQIVKTLKISRNAVQKYADMDGFNTTKPEVKIKNRFWIPIKQSSIRFLLKIRNDELSKGVQPHVPIKNSKNLMAIKKVTQLLKNMFVQVKKQMNMSSSFNKLQWLPGSSGRQKRSLS